MSEEQEKHKPKATLIKQKKDITAPPKAADETGEKGEKKKIVVVKKKVVVKKASPKVVPKVTASREDAPGTPEVAASTSGPRVPSKERPAETRTPASSDTPPVTPESPPVREESPAARQRSSDAPQSRPRQDPGSRPGAPGRAPQGGRPHPAGGSRPRPSGEGGRPQFFRRDGSPGQGPSGPRERGRYPDRQGSRPQGPRPGGGPGYVGGRLPPGARAPGGGRAPTGGRGPMGGARPHRPGPGGPRPPFGGGGRGGRPPAPASAGDQKGSNKKIFRAKKRDYSKRDRVHEKELQVKKKTVTRLNPVPKEIDIMEVITVSELARKMNLKASELIGKLMSMGMMVTINQQIDAETASILAQEYNCKVNIVSLYDETIIESEEVREEDLLPRPPIVTIMGHVDHGKTKLLDAVRTSNVAAGEFGGITQHIGAYTVKLPEGKITFLDTPGHEAFTMMRARGAQITDIVVLVVAANDGVMPQTIEAINHAKEAKVPIIVAINKIDLPEANPDRIKQQLSDHDLIPEEWGGKTLFVEISALKKLGIDELLENILLQAEILDLKAGYCCNAEGKIIESKIDHGRGIVATVLIERGTLRVGDTFVAGIYPGKIRAMFNDKGERLEEGTPSMPVEILGLTGIPNSGDPLQVTESERIARQIGDKRQELRRQEESRNLKKITLDNLYDSIQEGAVQELKVVIKGDVHGSVEALKTSLEKLSTAEIKLTVIQALAGAVNEGDVRLASASEAIIIGFHVRPTPKAQQLADLEKVEIRKYNVIYDAVEDIRAAMEGLLAPDIKEETIGVAEVRDTFKVPRIGLIGGCYVLSGKVRRNAQVHVIRDGIVIHTGKISSLRRFKDDAREVEAGFECGIGIEGFTSIRVGDQFEVFELKEIAKKLGESINE